MLKIRGDQPQPTTELWLEEKGGKIYLNATDPHGREWHLLGIGTRTTLCSGLLAAYLPDLKIKDGRLVVENA